MTVRGRQVTTSGLVLRTMDYREVDRISTVFTEMFGKVPARFIGVNRPLGKLKGLAEPMSFAEFRIYLRDGSDFPIVTGGAIVDVFPPLRASLAGTLRGLQVVELLDRMTPEWKPSPEKLALAVETLRELEKNRGLGHPARWIVGAYALRLFDLAGYGLRERRVSDGGREIWETLHQGAWEDVAALPGDVQRLGLLEGLVRNTVERVTERPLNTAKVIDSLVPVLSHIRN